MRQVYYCPNFPGSALSWEPINGYLILRDGTRYWIQSTADANSIPLIRWMRDRNGNLIRFEYGPEGSGLAYAKVTRITDSLNREVTFVYTTTQNTITYSGFGGATRTIRIIKTTLSDYALRDDYITNDENHGVRTYGQLFPEMSGMFKPYSQPTPNTLYNPVVDKSVILPDGRRYELRYNPYGGIARVELPTGGAIEYDYTIGTGVIGDSDFYEIWRQVVERRVYADGVTLEGKMKYSYQTMGGDENPITVATIKHCVGNSPLAIDLHYYRGDPQVDLHRGPTSYPAFDEGREFKTEWLDNASTPQNPMVRRRVEQTWENRAHVTWWIDGSSSEPANDPRITKTVTTLMDTGTTTSKVSQQTFEYDDDNNQTDVFEYDYGSGQTGAKLRHTHTDYLTVNPVNNQNYASDTDIHTRNLPVKQQVFQVINNTEVEQARTTYEYDKYDSTSNHAALVARTSITGHDDDFSTSYKTRGNVTAISRWLKDENRYLTTYQQYDVAGNVVKAIDARGNATVLTYTDNYGAPDGDTGAEAGGNQHTYAFATSVTNPLNQTVYTQYDYSVGKAVEVKDANGVVTSLYYGGLLDRPVKVIRDATNMAAKSQTLFTYLDAQHIVRTTSDLNTFGDSKQKSEVEYDGLGRTTKTRSFETGVNYIVVEQRYDALGRVSQQSNPYRPYLSEQAVWTLTSYDDLSRVTGVRTPDSAIVRTTYSNDVVTMTDQAGKDRESQTDALGRLVKVVEDPGTNGLNYTTTYTYDALDNLRTVTQGSQTRTFTYDSVSRLQTATNPESGTILYEYDDNGNLTRKTDARSVVTTYTYDELNRVKTRSYGDTTLSVTYTYDNQALPSGAPTASEFTRGVATGRLVAVTYGASGEATPQKTRSAQDLSINCKQSPS